MATVTRSKLTALRKTHFSDCLLVEISNLNRIKQYNESKASCCWVSHEELEGGWVQLFNSSPAYLGAKPLVGVCRIENYRKACGVVNTVTF